MGHRSTSSPLVGRSKVFTALNVGRCSHLNDCPSAVTNAVYHATGVRVRELPVRIEKLHKTACYF
jgi:hypothetical protein